jgi:nicotinate dehydrogenase subunit B
MTWPAFDRSPGRALTPDARAALYDAGISRRQFLRTSGALIVTFSATGVTGPAAQGPQAASGALDAWLAIAADGRVTAYTGKCELGQGLFTAQTQLVAEELGVPIDHVTLVQCDTARTPDQGTTSGAQSHPANFNQANLARAAATARLTLLRIAAARLDVPVQGLTTVAGAVQVSSDPSRRVSYGDLVGGRTFGVSLDPGAPRRDPADWDVLGQPVPRLDLPAMVTARFEYVHDVALPGMLHGQVVRPPAVGARVVSVDERSVADMPGVVRVVRRNDFVGVVAERPWQALQAANRLQVTWSEGSGLPDRSGFFDRLRTQPARDTLLVDSGDVEAALARAAVTLRATYRHPYQMHGSLGTSCAVADVRPGEATIYSATQAVHPHRNTAALLLDLPPDRVRVIFRMGSGCYGINGAEAVSYDAAILSQAVGRPVRVQLTRGDEMAWENYGAAFVIDQRAGLDTTGTIVVWDHESWSPNRGGRPGANRPGNVITGLLAGFEPAPFTPRSPAPAPGGFNNNSNAAPSYVAGCAGGRCGGTGTIRSERVLAHIVESPLWTGPLRSPQRLQNTFAHECFLDEIAAHVGTDPVTYRRRHLSEPRLIGVLEAAARAANWETRPSPRPDRPRTGMASGRGVACVLYEGNNGYCALVAEVAVDLESGAVRPRRFVIASDCGPISNPDGLRNQLEGGALQGLSRALVEEVTWDDRQVTSIDWRSYPSLSLGVEMPAIECVLIDPGEGPAMGAGETSVTVVAAAIGNAIFDATGARLREVPFTPARVRAALA